MNIKGLDYNTQREKLPLPEYGREIQMMVEHAVQLPTREERLRCAKRIVKVMELKVPQVRESGGNYQQTLWDHLYLMSRQQLDIDWPYDPSGAEQMNAKPQRVPLPQSFIRYRHYGRLVEEMIKRLTQMEPSAERDELARQTANQMKRDLIYWGHGSADDARVVDELARLTDGRVVLDLSKMSLERVAVMSDQMALGGKKKKKK